MSNPAPIVRLRGTVHAAPVANPVADAPAQPEQRDQDGRLIRPAYPARPGYNKWDVNVLTDDGGFVTLVMREESLAQVDGWMPERGERIDVPVRMFVSRRESNGRWYSVPGVSLAGDVLSAENSTSSGARVAAVS